MTNYGQIMCTYCPRKRGVQVVYDKKARVPPVFACKKHRKIAFEEIKGRIQHDESL